MLEPFYQNEHGKLYCGDCLTIMPLLIAEGVKVDSVVTDPPYGIGMSKQIGKKRGETGDKWESEQWDEIPAPQEAIDLMLSISGNQIIWGGNYFNLPPSRCFLIWDKVQRISFADCEMAWTNLEESARIFTFARSNMQGFRFPERQHPTQKPVNLMQWCLTFVPDAQLILDPFAGSGTTLVAAQSLGRKWIGIEISQTYADICVKRLEGTIRQIEGQASMFEGGLGNGKVAADS